MTQPRLITFSEHYRTGIRLLYFHYSDILPSNSQMTEMHSPAHQGWVTDSGWRITECLTVANSDWLTLATAGPSVNWFSTHTPGLTPVTAWSPGAAHVLTNQSPAWLETDQSQVRTAALYIWAPYGHASHRTILATFISDFWWMGSKGLHDLCQAFIVLKSTKDD